MISDRKKKNNINYFVVGELSSLQPRSQDLRGETVTKTLVKFILSFQNFGKKSHAQCDTTVLQ